MTLVLSVFKSLQENPLSHSATIGKPLAHTVGLPSRLRWCEPALSDRLGIYVST